MPRPSRRARGVSQGGTAGDAQRPADRSYRREETDEPTMCPSHSRKVDTMLKTRTWISAAAIGAAALMAGCAAGPNQQMGAGVGALGGAVVGNAIGGNTAATVGGAAIGGLVGNEIGRQRDQQNYNNQYYYPDGSRRY